MQKDDVKVLIVDDEPHILKTMGICFEDLGYDITTCLDPLKAMELIGKKPFDLAFVDLKMSPIDGLKILETILSRTPETTVIIITAHGSIESAIEAIKKGAYHYLQKPFDFCRAPNICSKSVGVSFFKKGSCSTSRKSS